MGGAYSRGTLCGDMGAGGVRRGICPADIIAAEADLERPWPGREVRIKRFRGGGEGGGGGGCCGLLSNGLEVLCEDASAVAVDTVGVEDERGDDGSCCDDAAAAAAGDEKKVECGILRWPNRPFSVGGQSLRVYLGLQCMRYSICMGPAGGCSRDAMRG
jgi:hypothetical protein